MYYSKEQEEVKIFHIADADAIKRGEITDVYFTRVQKVLEEGKIDKRVLAEVRATSLPNNWRWAVLAGIEEVLSLFSGVDVDIWALPEGSLFYPEDPVLFIEGRYLNFAIFETALLGLLCQASGIATKASRCKLAAEERPVYSFGARRMHPALAPMIERNAYIGGCDGVAVIASGKLIGEEPIGTMSHSLILVVGSDVDAFELFDKVMPKEIKRIALIDTFDDEKFASIRAAKVLGKRLFGVRLDTPRSRRGSFPQILQEVRWELNLRGYKDVKIFVSGGLDENVLLECNIYADAYGVGTAISNAPVVDFSLDIVEVEGKPLAKRGKMSGRKQVALCNNCQNRLIVPATDIPLCPKCGHNLQNLLIPHLKRGKIAIDLRPAREIREFVLEQTKGKNIREEHGS